MRARITSIFPYSENLEWCDLEPSVDPRNDYFQVSVDIGPDDFDGADIFTAVVAKDIAIGRAKRFFRTNRVIEVQSISEAGITEAISNLVESVEGDTWQQIVDQLLPHMSWEFEGMERRT